MSRRKPSDPKADQLVAAVVALRGGGVLTFAEVRLIRNRIAAKLKEWKAAPKR